MHIASSYESGFDVAVTAADLAEFSRKWPCFGTQTAPFTGWRGAALLLSFDRKGDLTDIQGDEGLDETGVSALVDDARKVARERGELPA
jgi:hypothetical protein